MPSDSYMSHRSFHSSHWLSVHTTGGVSVEICHMMNNNAKERWSSILHYEKFKARFSLTRITREVPVVTSIGCGTQNEIISGSKYELTLNTQLKLRCHVFIDYCGVIFRGHPT